MKVKVKISKFIEASVVLNKYQRYAKYGKGWKDRCKMTQKKVEITSKVII